MKAGFIFSKKASEICKATSITEEESHPISLRYTSVNSAGTKRNCSLQNVSTVAALVSNLLSRESPIPVTKPESTPPIINSPRTKATFGTQGLVSARVMASSPRSVIPKSTASKISPPPRRRLSSVEDLRSSSSFCSTTSRRLLFCRPT